MCKMYKGEKILGAWNSKSGEFDGVEKFTFLQT